MASGYWDWDATAPLPNGTIDPSINWAEGMFPSAVNNSARANMQRFAQFLDDQGFGTAGGTADALTLTPLNTISAYASNIFYSFKAASSNTGAATLNISAVGAKSIRKISGGTDVALSAGDIAAAGRYVVVYDSTANTAAGAFILVNPAFTVAALTFATNAQAEAGTSTTLPVNPANLAALLYAGTDNAGGSTITMGDGGYFNLITSTTAITAFAFTNDAVGRTARVRFNTARTLTHNATSLIIPGGASITTVAGDIAQIRSLGSGNFVVEWYTGTLTERRGGTNQTSYATGDTLYASGANTLAKRTIGSTGDVLTVSGGLPVWAAPATGGQPIPTNSTFAVGTFGFFLIGGASGSGLYIANGSTTTGASLLRIAGTATTPAFGTALTGTWQNVSGQATVVGGSAIANAINSYWVRTA